MGTAYKIDAARLGPTTCRNLGLLAKFFGDQPRSGQLNYNFNPMKFVNSEDPSERMLAVEVLARPEHVDKLAYLAEYAKHDDVKKRAVAILAEMVDDNFDNVTALERVARNASTKGARTKAFERLASIFSKTKDENKMVAAFTALKSIDPDHYYERRTG